MMRLFSNFDRSDESYRGSNESQYEYLDRSSRSTVGNARTKLENWFDLYPDIHKERLQKQFTNKDDHIHYGALWELLLFQWFLNSGMKPEVSIRTPDFTCTVAGKLIAIEATTISHSLGITQDDLDNLGKLISGISSNTHRLLYCVDPDYDEGLNENNKFRGPFGNKHRNQIEDWVKHLPEGNEFVSPLKINGAIIHCQPIENKDYSSEHEFAEAPFSLPRCTFHEKLRCALAKKGKKLGHGIPNIIAVACYDYILDQIDIENALFGNEQITFYNYSSANGIFSKEKYNRASNGVLGFLNNPKYSRITGVIIAQDVKPHSIEPIRMFLYENPWAETIIPNELGDNRKEFTAWSGLAYFRREFTLQL